MRVLWVWGPALAWMAGTFYISHQSVVDIPLGAPDYLAHGVAYAVLGGLYVRALAGGQLATARWSLVWPAVVLAALYGLSDEFHQSFIPGRLASVSDLVADTVGALAGASLTVALGTTLRDRKAAGEKPRSP